MNIEVKKVVENLHPLLTLISGDPTTPIERMSSPDQAFINSIIFVPDEKALKQVLKSQAAALVISENLKNQAKEWPRVLLSTPHLPLALSQVGRHFFPVTTNKMPFDGERIHPSAVISQSAQIDDMAIIGPNTTIGAHCKIGKGVVIGPNTAIEANCVIGEKTHIHGQVSISHGTQIGARCEVHPQTSLGTEGFGYAQDKEFNHYRITHYGRLILEDDVHIGAGVTMDRGTFADSRVGKGTIIDNMNHFGHNFICGERTIFVGGTIVAGSVTMGSRCVIGGRVSIAGHLKICDNVHIAGMSGVTKDITEPGQYGGYPLQPLKNSLRSLSSLAALPEMRKTLAELVKKVNNKS
ncbi:MAG: UDP-3-O-(3-hydroxymyristoyl)glucosamine N-acyltransferase [Bdellovibrionales bacterium]|nr:UDP-3-O-(3-hydroxymyristoyl)glucosamine N-acyltransferase [Bdellovibrionales bacterium]